MHIQYKPIVHKGENRILVMFKFDANIVKNLRKKTDARWSKTHTAWHIADTENYRLKCKLPIVEKIKVVSAYENSLPKVLVKTNTYNNNEEVKTTVFLKPIFNTDGIAFIALMYDNEKLDIEVRKIENVKWHSTAKMWFTPCNAASYHALNNRLKGIAIIDNVQLSNYLKNRDKIKLAESAIPNVEVPKTIFKKPVISVENRKLLTKTTQLIELKAYSKSTLKTYKTELQTFLQTLGNRNAETLKTDEVRRYIHYCITKLNLSENTVHSRLNALKFMYEQVLGHTKFFVEIPRPKKHLQLPKVLGENELRRLFAAPQNLKHKAILFVAYSAGLRVSEVINLRIQDIDREREQLFIFCSKGKKDRYVRLSPLVLDVLEQYFKKMTLKPTNYLFEGQEKGKPYTIRTAQQIFTDAKMKAGILKSVSFHALRHSFATHLLEKGVDVIFIKEILGHFDIRTTERYLHVRRDVLINIPSPIDDLYKNEYK